MYKYMYVVRMSIDKEKDFYFILAKKKEKDLQMRIDSIFPTHL